MDQKAMKNLVSQYKEASWEKEEFLRKQEVPGDYLSSVLGGQEATDPSRPSPPGKPPI